MAFRSLGPRWPFLASLTLALLTPAGLAMAQWWGMPAENNPMVGENCLNALRESGAVNSKGLVRFALHELTLEYTSTSPPDVVLNIEPNRFNKSNLLCHPKIAPGGAIQVGGVQLRLDGGPPYSGSNRDIGQVGGRFVVTFTDMWPNALKLEKKWSLENGALLPRGEQFGTQLYQVVIGLKDKKPTPDAVYLGAHYVGISPGGHFAIVKCSEFELAKNYMCRLHEEIRDNVMLSIELPPENVPLWAKYSAAAERYFESHLECNPNEAGLKCQSSN